MASKGLFSWFRKKSAPESNNAEKVELAKDDVGKLQLRDRTQLAVFFLRGKA